MARQRKEKSVKPIKLTQPDRSGPTEGTLLDLAQERNLFQQADARKREIDGVKDDDGDDSNVLSPGAERYLETALWTVTLAIVHFTFDVLVHHQYGTELNFPKICTRTARAWLGA
jgi:hypothetical protein